jgi:hypothetical protein
MKLTDILLLGVTGAFLIIGTDQTIAFGFKQSYWAFMLALIPFFIFNFRRNRKPDSEALSKKGKTVKKTKNK